MVIMHSTGRREPRWIPFAVCFAVSGTAWAEDVGSAPSASAHIPLTHSRDVGASVNVRHKF